MYAELAGLAASRYTWSDSGDLVAGEAEIPSLEGAKTDEEFLGLPTGRSKRPLVREADERANRAFIHDQAY